MFLRTHKVSVALSPAREMARLSVALILISFAGSLTMAQAETSTSGVDGPKEKVTNLQFYFHDTLSGNNPTAMKVAKAADTERSPTLFGTLMMADDPLTETPDPKSKLVGRAQGLYGSAGQQQLGLLMAMTYEFIDYSGSSISILGKNPAMDPVREMPVIGGTGVFRFARGFAVAKTYWFNATTCDAIVGYNVTLIHF